jgi:chemotaxis protein methyltransferase CheR
MSSEFELSEVDYRLLCDVVRERFGVCLREERRRFIEMQLYPRLIGLGVASFSEYVRRAKYAAPGDAELTELISLLTNNETYFCREAAQLEVFARFVLPELRNRKSASGSKKVRIMSAGCSTGEEAYTLAILIYEAGTFFWWWDVKVLGVDVSVRVIETARRGIYSARSFRADEALKIKTNFTESPEGFEVKPGIRRLTSFTPGNLIEPATWEQTGKVDVIFCRNVLIYFTRDTYRRVVQSMFDALEPGGYLFLGHSETLAGVFDDFEAVRLPGSTIHRKPT